MSIARSLALAALAAGVAPVPSFAARQVGDVLVGAVDQAAELHLAQFQVQRAPARRPDASAVTVVSSPHPIASVLKTMRDEHIRADNWQFIDKIGQSVMPAYSRLIADLPRLGTPGSFKNGTCVKGEYFGTAFDLGMSVDNSNGLLKCHGFTIQLEPPEPDAEEPVSAAATLVIEEDWFGVTQGTELRVVSGGASHLKPGAFVQAAGFMKSAAHPYPIVGLKTVRAKGGNNLFFMTPYDGKLAADDALAALSAAQLIRRQMESDSDANRAYRGVVFPKAAFSNVNKTLLKKGTVVAPADHPNKRIAGKRFVMDQFLFEQKIKIHETGISLKAAAAGQASLERSMPVGPDMSKAYVIDNSYLFWIEVNGVVPFAGLITPADMKEPPQN
ncbi:MAG: hypothetical protein HY059_09080 [Proteobacteria bacterium]|nr:hypothetical protein [Pseudomonadota bacterium]